MLPCACKINHILILANIHRNPLSFTKLPIKKEKKKKKKKGEREEERKSKGQLFHLKSGIIYAVTEI